VVLTQHPDEHRSERPVLLAVDQELGEGPALRVAPELADPVGALEVGNIRTWSSSARRAGPSASRRSRNVSSNSCRVDIGSTIASKTCVRCRNAEKPSPVPVGRGGPWNGFGLRYMAKTAALRAASVGAPPAPAAALGSP
jgi:hypothetical protein